MTPEDRDDQDAARSDHAADLRSIAADEARHEWPDTEPAERDRFVRASRWFACMTVSFVLGFLVCGWIHLFERVAP